MKTPPIMLFAAGFGTRMGSLTADQPKPLVHVAGRALIDHAMDIAHAADITKVVVNLHYRGEQLQAHLRDRDISFSWEREQILETGGGLRAAIPLLGASPVLTLNPDVIWTGMNPLLQLLEQWDEKRMDALLLLLPVADAGRGKGDFRLSPDGKLARGGGGETHVYLGAQLVRTEGLLLMPEGAFSMNLLWNHLIQAGRAFGTVHQGGWCDVGHPGGIALAEALLKAPHVS